MATRPHEREILRVVLPRGAVARHALRCRPPLVVWRALTLVSRNEPLSLLNSVFFLRDGVLVVLEVPNCQKERERESLIEPTPRVRRTASGLKTLARSKLGSRRPGSQRAAL